MRKSGGEPMSCGYSPTPPAACDWSAHSPSKPTKTGSNPTATSTWTNCASRRKPNYAKPHDQHHDRHFAELDAHNHTPQVRPAIGLTSPISSSNRISHVSSADRRVATKRVRPVQYLGEP